MNYSVLHPLVKKNIKNYTWCLNNFWFYNIIYVFAFQISLQTHTPSTLSHLPLLLRWYQRVQELPSVLRAAKGCGMALLSLRTVDPCPPQPEAPRPSGAEQEGPKLKQEPFVGGPRPTLTKLQVIEFHSLSFAPALLLSYFILLVPLSLTLPAHGRRLHMPRTSASLCHFTKPVSGELT